MEDFFNIVKMVEENTYTVNVSFKEPNDIKPYCYTICSYIRLHKTKSYLVLMRLSPVDSETGEIKILNTIIPMESICAIECINKNKDTIFNDHLFEFLDDEEDIARIKEIETEFHKKLLQFK